VHVLVYRDINAPNGPIIIETYYSLNLAVLKMWQVRRTLIQFCIDHPFSDLLTLPTPDDAPPLGSRRITNGE
jgi:hypothetical protein